MGALSRVSREYSSRSWPKTRLDFARELIRPKGRAFDLSARPFMVDLYANESRQRVVMKAAQMGGTLCEVSLMLWYASPHGGGRHGMYFLDAAPRVQDWVNGYLRDLLVNSPGLARGVTDPDEMLRPVQGMEEEGYRKSGADSTRMLHFCGTPIYFRPLGVLAEAKSVPADVVIVDEGEEAGKAGVRALELSLIDMVEDRLLASTDGYASRISQPGMVNFGIHRDFEASDGREWMHRCVRGHWTDTATGMDSLTERIQEKDGDYRILCGNPGCDAELYRWDEGAPPGKQKVFVGDDREWVPQRPSSEVAGWHLAQTYGPGPMVSPKKLKEAGEKARGNPSQEARVQISILGLPASSNLQPLSRPIIEACGDPQAPFYTTWQSQTFGAVDMGDEIWWMTGEMRRTGPVVLSYGHSRSKKEVVDALNAMNAFIIVDERPEKRIARQMIRECRGGVLCRFAEVEKPLYKPAGDSGIESDGDQVWVDLIKANREEMIMGAVAAFLNRTWKIPMRGPDWHLVVAHCVNLVKQRDLNGREKFVRGVENHYGFTLGYLLLLMQMASQLQVATEPVETAYQVYGERQRGREW